MLVGEIGFGEWSLIREQVADAVGVHANYLSTICSQIGGKTFRRTIESARLAHAQWMLRTTDWTIGQIAVRCGFRSSAYFVSVFRKAFEQTPGDIPFSTPSARHS